MLFMYLQSYMYVTLKSFVVYFRSYLQPFLYVTHDKNFDGKICLVIDKVLRVQITKNF